MYKENNERIICKHEGCTNLCPTSRTGPKGVIQHKQCHTCSKLLSKYGITNGDRLRLLNEQNHKCAICQKEIALSGRFSKGDKDENSAVIDHNHNTGKIRKLLCSSCNIGLGKFYESEENLTNAIKYLKSFKRQS